MILSWYLKLWRMGYLADQRGIRRRYFIERKHWEQHLANTRNFIVDACKTMTHGKAAILGSGWLLDVPLDFLASCFKEVFLFDIHHPRAVKQQTRRYPNVRLVTADVSGGAMDQCYQAVRYFKKHRQKIPVEQFTIQGFREASSFDCIVSLNLLNQLDMLAVDYLASRHIYNEKELGFLHACIQQQHLHSLPEGKTILISDVEEIWYDSSHHELGRKSLLYVPFPSGKIKKTWEWTFDTHYRYYPDKNVSFKVIAAIL